MPRLAAYLGPATKIAQVIEAGSTSLSLQSAAFPAGHGVAWYPIDDDQDAPLVMRGVQPLINERPVFEVTRRYPAECVVASIGAGQPYRFEQLLFAHDGEIERFEEVYARILRERLSDTVHPLVKTSEPSELLFATWLDALEGERGPDAMANALERMVSTLQEIAHRHDAPAAFGCLVTDGTCLITLRTATQGTPPALYTIVANEESPVPATGRVVASEPLFSGSWTALDPHSLVIFTVEPNPPQ